MATINQMVREFEAVLKPAPKDEIAAINADTRRIRRIRENMVAELAALSKSEA